MDTSCHKHHDPYVQHSPCRGSITYSEETHASTPIALGLSIRRMRLVGFTVMMVVFIAGIAMFFNHGMALTYFDSRDKNATERTKLLDDYNSYSGNISSIFAKPIELFVTVAVQVIVLRFMADMFIRPELSWRSSAITLLFGAGVGYLLSNSFHALNVQLRHLPVTTAIAEADLQLQSNFLPDNQSSSFDKTFSELRPHNSVTNTLLRTAVMPKSYRQLVNCSSKPWDDALAKASNGTADQVKEAFVNLGFMQREWQGQILQQASPATSLRVIVNPTNKSVNSAVNSTLLPMNSTIAADLFYYGITMSTEFFPWGTRNAFVNDSDVIDRFRVNNSQPLSFVNRTAQLYGLLPPTESDEATQKAWFLRESVAAMSRQFAFSKRTKQSDLVLEFTHTQLTSQLAFDAVTFEVEIDPMLLATSVTTTNATRYTVLDQLLHCPTAERCMVEKVSYSASEPSFDPPAQIIAFSMCADKYGTERIRSNVTILNNTLQDHGMVCELGYCDQKSMLIVSIGKHLEADSLEQNVNVTIPDNSSVTITNLRKMYTFTVGRLSWQSIDLTQAFNARCNRDKNMTCTGLQMELSTPLDTTRSSTTDQRLILGDGSIPIDLLATPDVSLAFARTNLVILDEPPQAPSMSKQYKVLAGDVLLPHNVGTIKWALDIDGGLDGCNAQVADRIVQALNNHLYMEHGLQTAYTAAVYFLYMRSSVKNVIKLSPTKWSLDFAGNSQSIAVWISTPYQNMWLTLSGCFLLLFGLAAALIKASWFTQHEEDALANITEPQVIARVIVDERNYPPIFLRRHVVEKDRAGNIDNYAISALSLQQQQEEMRGRNQQDVSMLSSFLPERSNSSKDLRRTHTTQ